MILHIRVCVCASCMFFDRSQPPAKDRGLMELEAVAKADTHFFKLPKKSDASSEESPKKCIPQKPRLISCSTPL